MPNPVDLEPQAKAVADAMRRYLDRFDKATRRCDFRRWTALNLQRYLA